MVSETISHPLHVKLMHSYGLGSVSFGDLKLSFNLVSSKVFLHHSEPKKYISRKYHLVPGDTEVWEVLHHNRALIVRPSSFRTVRGRVELISYCTTIFHIPVSIKVTFF